MDTSIIIEKYKSGDSLAELSRQTNISVYRLKKILVAQGVVLRTKAEQTAITNKRRKKKSDTDYFHRPDNFQKGWLLGFIASDGTVRKGTRNSIKIGLSQKDIEILYKIKKELSIERDVETSITNKGYSVCQLEWSEEKHKEKLLEYGIIPNKTYEEMRVPDFSNKETMIGFLLGYFDGDGSLSDDGNTCRVRYCAYRPEILESISKKIEQLTGFSKQVYKDPSRENYYELTYSTQQGVLILNLFYSCRDACEGFSLERKFKKFCHWKQSHGK